MTTANGSVHDNDPGRVVMRRADGKPINVLVVDDEPVLAELVSMALRYEGWDIATAGDGATAISLARDNPPDVVVLDVMLPDMSGLDVLHRLREQIPGLPLLLLTAKDSVEDRIAGLTAGGDDYVTKPFSIEEVVLRLRALLRRTGVASEAGGAQIVVGDLVLDEDSHEVTRAGETDHFDRHRVRTAAVHDAQFEARAEQGADPRPGVELRLRRSVEHRRAVRVVPAQEDRQRTRADDPHLAGRGVCPQASPLSPAANA